MMSCIIFKSDADEVHLILVDGKIPISYSHCATQQQIPKSLSRNFIFIN